MNSPTALVLDFGGVVTRTLFETHDLTEQALGLAQGSLRWRGPFDPQSDRLWQRMQRDEISERDYWMARTKQVGELVGQDWNAMADFVKAARGADPQPIIRPQALSAIAKARQAGVKLAILSNELDLFYGAEFRKKLPALSQLPEGKVQPLITNRPGESGVAGVVNKRLIRCPIDPMSCKQYLGFPFKRIQRRASI